MEIFLVGGAVRDKLLGLPVKERDWVVVGTTPDVLIAQGFKPVGKHFPVFLHPQTKEEYALARTESKTAPGYHGFEFRTSPDVSLNEDLKRRDLTVNAVAQDAKGKLIDPYGGIEDLNHKTLRHVSTAFSEDPVRILRVARFAARYKQLGFHVAEETLTLMQDMVINGEVDALVPERVWQELDKSMREDSPGTFIETLRACGALSVLFPELEQLWGVPQTEKYHPEIDTGIHTLMVLARAAKLSSNPEVRFAALTHDLGKGNTPKEEWPKHHGHEVRGAELVERMCDRLKTPKSYRDLARLVARYHLQCHQVHELRPATVLKLLAELDAFRRRERFGQFLLACEADYRGRKGYEETHYSQAIVLRDALEAAQGVDIQPMFKKGYRGTQLADRLRQERITAIKLTLQQK